MTLRSPRDDTLEFGDSLLHNQRAAKHRHRCAALTIKFQEEPQLC